MDAKRIEVVELSVKDLNHQFGNPRKISKKGVNSLDESLERFGDFGVIVIDENNSIICGNQRVDVLKAKDENAKVLCKRLIGYSVAEKRAINIKDNRHEGEDNFELLTDWIADLNIDFGIDFQKEKKIKEGFDIELLEPIRYEKYDFVIIACKSELDYINLCDKLELSNKKDLITTRSGKQKKIRRRAVWYDEIPVDLVKKQEVKSEQ